MMESNQAIALPSTSQESFHTCLGEQQGDRDDAAAMRCLDLIGKIASKLKSDTSGFSDVLLKILAVIEDETVNRESKYELIDKVMINIMDADREELVSMRGDFEKIFCTREVRKLWVDDSVVVRTGFLGEGAFGIVIRGILKGSGGTTTRVAIKSTKDARYQQIIENEASVMSQLNHKNIMKLLAITKSSSEIVMELMDLGNLVEAVENVNFSVSNLLKFLNDIASGMEYLHGKKYLHRDLACRNIFLNSKKKCKIGDLGFCVYVGDSEGVYLETVFKPHDYNLSPETLVSKEFTMESDVWAMGILCWELFYIVEHANEIPPATFTKKIKLQSFLQSGHKLPKSKLCTEDLYSYISTQLLETRPKARPNFTVVKETIKKFISSS